MHKFALDKDIINALSDNLRGSGGGPVLFQDKENNWHAYQGELHSLYIGPTGKGKSQYGINPLIRSLITNGESIVMEDPKGECTAYFQHLQAEGLVPEDAKITILDMTRPNESMGYNVFSYLFELLRSKDIGDNQLGETFAAELVDAICTESSNLKDSSFWNNCSKSLFSGLINLFYEMADVNDVPTMSYFTEILNSASPDILKNGDFIDALCQIFDSEGIAVNDINVFTKSKTNSLPMYNTVFRDIRTTYISDLNKMQRGSAINAFMSHNDFRISDLDLNRQNIIMIIKPDNFKAYDVIVSIMISQLSQFLISKADNYYEERKLPVRVNFIREELGNIGGSIPNLPQLMTAGRSRNIRLHLVLQNLHQLDKVFKEMAPTILANIGVTVAFGCEDQHTKRLLSERCGHYYSEFDPSIEQPVIRPEDIGKMRVGQALVFLPGGIVYVSDLAQIRKPATYRLNREAYLVNKELSSNDLRESFNNFLDRAFVKKYAYLITGRIPKVTEQELDLLSTVIPPNFSSGYDNRCLLWGILALLYHKRFIAESDFHLLDVFKEGIPFSIPNKSSKRHNSWLIWALKELKLCDFSVTQFDGTLLFNHKKASAKRKLLDDYEVD